MLEKDLQRLVDQDKKLTEECTELKAKLDKEKSDHSSAKAELAKVKARMASSQQQLDSLEKTIAELDKTKKSKQQDERDVEQQVAQLLPDIQASHARIRALQAEYDRVNGDCNALEKSNAALRAQADQQGTVAAELEQSRAKVDDLLKQLNEINAARTEQEQEVEQLRKEEQQLKAARAKTEQLRKELEEGTGTSSMGSPSSGTKSSPSFLSGWTRSIWGQDENRAASPAEIADAQELAAVEKETEEWKAKAQELEKTLAELTKQRDDNAQAASRVESDAGGARASSTRTPSSAVSDGFDDAATTASYVPDQRTQALLTRMKDTIGGLKNKINELQKEENALRAENSKSAGRAVARERWLTAGALWLRSDAPDGVGRCITRSRDRVRFLFVWICLATDRVYGLVRFGSVHSVQRQFWQMRPVRELTERERARSSATRSHNQTILVCLEPRPSPPCPTHPFRYKQDERN